MSKWQQLIGDRSLQWRAIILCFLILGGIWQVGILSQGKGDLSRLRAEREQEMERLASDAQGDVSGQNVMITVRDEYGQKKKYILEGITTRDGKFIALINGAVYAQGDKIDGYVVDKITLNTTTMINPATQEIRTIRFREQEVFPATQ